MTEDFEFVGGRPCLDFAATVAERGTTEKELLQTAADLQRWIAQAHLVEAPPPIPSGAFTRARELREATFSVLSAALESRRPCTGDRELINATASQLPIGAILRSDGRVQRTGDIEAILATLARDCLDLLGGPDHDRLAACADEACTRLFLDASRGRRRRWCGMRGCGDRAKAAAYRARRSSPVAG